MNSKLLAGGVAAVLALGLTACGKDSEKKDTGSTGSTGSTAATGGTTVAGQLIYGGPAQFKTRPDGLDGLQKTYGIQFKSFQAMTDVGGPVTVGALKQGQIDAADLFTTDPAIKAN